jgi:hypothetical protein
MVRMDDLGNFRRGISIATFIGFGLSLFLLIAANPLGYGDYTFIAYFLLAVGIGLGVGFLYARIAANASGYAARAPAPAAPPPAAAGSATPGATATAPAVTKLSLPHLPNMRAISDDEVLAANLDEKLSSAAVRGGRADRGDSEPSVGVFVPTVAGLAFLPDVETLTVKTLRQSAPIVWGVAKEMLPGAELLEVAELVQHEGGAEKPRDLPEWLAKSRTRKDHFVIAWPDLVEVSVDPGKRITTLVRETPDGRRAAFMLETGETGLASALLQRRVHFEVTDLFLQHVIQPRIAELRPQVTEEFRKIYGDRLKDHTNEVEKEVWERAVTGVKVSDFIPTLAEKQPMTMEQAYTPYILAAVMELGN